MGQLIKNKFLSLFYYFIILIIIFAITVLLIFNNKKTSIDFNTINFKLIANTHTNLPWEFKPIKPLIEIKIGEIINIDYIVKNLSDKKTSGIASFNYYPRELDIYISKIQCFCYEIKTLNAGEEDKYTLTMMIDPKVTKDIKTKSIKKAIIQFTFFNSENYKENKS